MMTLLEINPTDGGLQLDGELDLATAELLTEALNGATPGEPLVLDFSGVTFMDSSGLRALLEAVRQRDGDTQLRILHPRPQVKRVFDISLPDGAPGLEITA